VRHVPVRVVHARPPRAAVSGDGAAGGGTSSSSSARIGTSGKERGRRGDPGTLESKEGGGGSTGGLGPATGGPLVASPYYKQLSASSRRRVTQRTVVVAPPPAGRKARIRSPRAGMRGADDSSAARGPRSPRSGSPSAPRLGLEAGTGAGARARSPKPRSSAAARAGDRHGEHEAPIADDHGTRTGAGSLGSDRPLGRVPSFLKNRRRAQEKVAAALDVEASQQQLPTNSGTAVAAGRPSHRGRSRSPRQGTRSGHRQGTPSAGGSPGRSALPAGLKAGGGVSAVGLTPLRQSVGLRSAGAAAIGGGSRNTGGGFRGSTGGGTYGAYGTELRAGNP